MTYSAAFFFFDAPAIALPVLSVGSLSAPAKVKYRPDAKNTNSNKIMIFIAPPYDLYSMGLVNLITNAVDTNIATPDSASMNCPPKVCISV